MLQHFAERDDLIPLQKLASHALPGNEAIWRMELLDAVVQLERQTVEQRIEELQAKNRDGGLDEADKYELRALLQARVGRG